VSGFKLALGEKYSIEPSGLTYLPDLKKFLIVSDDTDEDKSPVVFLMNPDGELEEQPLLIPGVKKVADLESVSAVGDSVYFLSGQGLNKKGKNKSSRNLFIKSTRTGMTLKDSKSVELRDQLIAAIQNSKDADVQKAFKGFDPKEFEIESHYIDKGDLYVGVKAPLMSTTESVILKIPDVEKLFATSKISEPKVARLIHLELSGRVHRLTDLSMIDGHLYATTSCKGADCGAVWKLADSKNPALLAFYDGLKPEGLAYDPQAKSILVTFDGKNNKAKFARTGLMPMMEKNAQAANDAQTLKK
jgi:hypothetical protein